MDPWDIPVPGSDMDVDEPPVVDQHPNNATGMFSGSNHGASYVAPPPGLENHFNVFTPVPECSRTAE